jgi:hypothetical protein
VSQSRGADFGPPESAPRPEHRWRGADDWRNHWTQPDEEETGREDRRRSGSPDPRAFPARQDPAVAPTRLDYGYPDEMPEDVFRPDDDRDPADAYREASVPAIEAAGDRDDDPVSARVDGNGAGIPLSWDDE